MRSNFSQRSEVKVEDQIKWKIGDISKNRNYVKNYRRDTKQKPKYSSRQALTATQFPSERPTNRFCVRRRNVEFSTKRVFGNTFLVITQSIYLLFSSNKNQTARFSLNFKCVKYLSPGSKVKVTTEAQCCNFSWSFMSSYLLILIFYIPTATFSKFTVYLFSYTYLLLPIPFSVFCSSVLQ